MKKELFSPMEIDAIGEMMNIKISTVKTHVSHILGKLGVRRRAEAVTAAKKLWLV